MKTYYILNYRASENFNEEKKLYQNEHIQLMKKAYEKGELILAGGLLNPSNGGMLIFNVLDQKIVEEFAKNDPYVKSGIIEKWDIRPWNIVIG
ncbi:YciI family protein [Tenacibaculum agarivorans]|uniref:YciI family protein n=1 Tax=Tenacibaculum agarivorans TaxID=1908389 RepID=UPI00094B82B4|nr:YciI family protein [Tenacibaculum agarivorans]